MYGGWSTRESGGRGLNSISRDGRECQGVGFQECL